MRYLPILAALVALVLAGCGSPADDLRSQEIPLPDGRVVTCVTFDSGSYAGGISCDWERAR